MRRVAAIVAGVALVWAAQVAAADRESEFRGRRLAEANCYDCHALALYDESLDPRAPPFRELALRGDVEALRADMAGDLFARHPKMPDFEPTPDQIDDLVDFIESLAP
ncbi:cytochrome c [Chelativorans sp. ZYF759]|uniref:c-type cytochrome n=1 Tax=Chelativorans sp. ZYF759 TaxID=2692213 RepID=UPI00145ECE65|nr:cytochrome c [Chelativorans sp. ZYF759]NMG40238.1 cytochrome c [Chelativorans sp. ZYF759]